MGLAHSLREEDTAIMVLEDDIRTFIDAVQSPHDTLSSLDERIVTVDRLAARLLGIVSQVSQTPNVILGIQRLLLLMGARRSKANPAVPSLLDALDRLDLDMGTPSGGFSRLLASAIDTGENIETQQLDESSFPTERQRFVSVFRQLEEQLSLLDDLGFAIGLRIDLPATAAALHGLFSILEDEDWMSQQQSHEVTQAWLVHRGVSNTFRSLFLLRPHLDQLTNEAVSLAREHNVSQPFALWLLSHRQHISKNRPPHCADMELIERLFSDANMVPAEIFSLADLSQDSR